MAKTHPTTVATAAGRWLLLPVFALSLVACTLEPQQVLIRPTLTIQPKALGRERELTLEVVDRRPRNVIGYRGGVDPMTAPLVPRSSVPGAVRPILTRALRKYGFVVHPPEVRSSPFLRVEIERLDYVAERRLWPTSVRTQGVVKVIYRNGLEYYANRFTAEYSEEVKWAPCETSNARLINRTLSKVLERAVTDPGLLERLSNANETRVSPSVISQSQVTVQSKDSRLAPSPP